MNAPYRYIYNPRKADTEELRRTLAARDVLLENLIDHARIHAATRSIQHLLLIGAFFTLLREKKTENLLEWIERIDDWLPAEKKGLFEPFAIAARRLSGKREYARILDQQPPEVRSVVKWILSEAEKDEVI